MGIWERDEGIRTAVEAGLGELAAEVRAGQLRRVPPGTAGPLARALNARQAVSYGTSPRDTLTFSSLEGDRLCLAVQRELVTLGGAVVEQQELVLPFSTGASPLPFLAAAGTLLLLGVPPEELPARLRSPV